MQLTISKWGQQPAANLSCLSLSTSEIVHCRNSAASASMVSLSRVSIWAAIFYSLKIERSETVYLDYHEWGRSKENSEQTFVILKRGVADVNDVWRDAFFPSATAEGMAMSIQKTATMPFLPREFTVLTYVACIL